MLVPGVQPPLEVRCIRTRVYSTHAHTHALPLWRGGGGAQLVTCPACAAVVSEGAARGALGPIPMDADVL